MFIVKEVNLKKILATKGGGNVNLTYNIDFY